MFGLFGSKSVAATPVRIGEPVELALVSGAKVREPSGLPGVTIWIREPLRYCPVPVRVHPPTIAFTGPRTEFRNLFPFPMGRSDVARMLTKCGKSSNA